MGWMHSNVTHQGMTKIEKNPTLFWSRWCS